jgi:hypothetical protein
MQELRMQAFPDGQRRPAPAARPAPGWEDDSEPGGGGADSDFNPDENQWQWLRDDASIGAAGGAGPDSWGMNFSVMELYASIHDLEQQQMANQTRGPVRDGDKRPFHCIQIRRSGALDIRKIS